MDEIERKKLIHDWIACLYLEEGTTEWEALQWAERALSNLSYENPILCLDFVLDIIKLDSSNRAIASLAAGVVEDMLIENGDLVIGRFEELASSNPSFKKLLGGVWLDDDVSLSIANRFEAIRGERW